MRPSVTVVLLLALGACEGQILDPSGAPQLVDAGPPGVDAGPLPPGVDAGPAPGFDAGPPPEPDAGPGDDGTTDMCGDLRIPTAIYHGDTTPGELPLREGQIWAVGSISGCSATLVAPTWALTAQHCGARAGGQFCIGRTPDADDVCIRISSAIDHPDYHRRTQWDADLTMLELAEDATERLPGVEPIPINTFSLDSSYVGRNVEAAGFGRTERGSSGTRLFVPVRISEIGDPFITLDGDGRKGICFGDSGGPIFGVAEDGTVRLFGDNSHIYGGPECMSYSRHPRMDLYQEWIEGFTGPTIVDGAPCGDTGTLGRCSAGSAMWCGDDDTLEIQRCEGGLICGWSERVEGFRCIEGEDPCGGFDLVGGCDASGNARWCDRGVQRTRDCGACGQVCGRNPLVGNSYDCVDDPCMGLDYHGRCNGEIAEYCKEGEFLSRDCGREGLSCGWVNDELGYWCQ